MPRMNAVGIVILTEKKPIKGGKVKGTKIKTERPWVEKKKRNTKWGLVNIKDEQGWETYSLPGGWRTIPEIGDRWVTGTSKVGGKDTGKRKKRGGLGQEW